MLYFCLVTLLEYTSTYLYDLLLLARDTKIDVVLVDTAGRMQDNEPLMRSLAKVSSKK